MFIPTASGGLACLIDGLGHGAAAADASERAAAAIRDHADAAPQDRWTAATRRSGTRAAS